MVSKTNSEAWDIANEFARWTTDQYHYFNEFLTLYDCSEKRRELLEKTAKEFFDDLFRMYIERIIQNISNLTDPPQTGKYQNFSIRSIHNFFNNCCGNYRNDKVPEVLVQEIEDKAKKVLSWRNKLVSHYDWNVAIGDKNVNDKFVRSDVETLYDKLQEYINTLFSLAFNDVFHIDAVSYYGAIELVRALKEAQALITLQNSDINAYHNLMSNSVFRDA